MFAAAALAASVLIDPALCRKVPGSVGTWETDGRGGLSASSGAGTVGTIGARCRIVLPAPAAIVTLHFDRVLISFQPSGSRATGSGLSLAVGDTCAVSLTRVAGEDWMQSANRAWQVTLNPPARAVHVSIALRDVSSTDPVRVDLQGLRISAGSLAHSEVCGPVHPEVNGNRAADKDP
jgi:hypothetical protein